MAIEDILRTLEEQANADCQDCMNEAEQHAKHILDEAQREAEAIRDRHAAQVERVAAGKASQQVNAARLESKMRVSAVKGDGLSATFEAAAGQLDSLRKREDYPAVLARLVSEALDDTDGNVVLRVNPADVEQVEAMLAQNGRDGEVAADAVVVGGVLVELDGGKILRRNTFADRLDRSRELIANDVAKVLLA